MYYIDQKLLRRFAEWMMAQEPTYAAGKLLRAVDSKSLVIGAHLKSAINSADLHGFRERMHQEFSLEECEAILGPMGAPASMITWEPSPEAKRQRRRSTALDEVAQGLGFETWRRFETAVLNGDVTIKLV